MASRAVALNYNISTLEGGGAIPLVVKVLFCDTVNPALSEVIELTVELDPLLPAGWTAVIKAAIVARGQDHFSDLTVAGVFIPVYG
jgi:hypothetical protein